MHSIFGYNAGWALAYLASSVLASFVGALLAAGVACA